MAFTNRDRLRRRLKAIPVAARKAIRAQMAANAEELVETQRRFVPVDEMKLHDSIRWRNVSDSTRISFRISAGNRQVPYARFVEFGTAASPARAPRQNLNFKRTVVMTKDYQAHAGTTAQPFFWPAYRLLRRKFKTRVARAAKKAVLDSIK